MTNRLREYRHVATGVIGTYTEQFAAIFPELELVEDVEQELEEPSDSSEDADEPTSETTPPIEP